jgi:regulator of protease activity HflC (stomatin/prohibitin superfamily)
VIKLLPRRFAVPPNYIGYLFRKNRFDAKLEPGIYRYFDPFWEMHVILLPTTSKIQNVVNQEVLTEDNIALRFSYFIEYRIGDPDKYMARFEVRMHSTEAYEAEQLLHNLTQVYLRDLISKVASEDLNDRREELLNVVPETLRRDLADYGIELVRLMLRDVTFPKTIQDLFARHLEAKIRAKADLENARTTVATARALKNAAELMKDDENIKFFQLLETITKIADKGKHTFVFGDLQQNRGGGAPGAQK